MSAAIAAGCMQLDPPAYPDGGTVLFEASFPYPDDLTRSSMDGNFAVRWDSSDEISVLGSATSSKGTVHSISPDGKGAVFLVAGVRDRELHAVHPYVPPGREDAPVLENGRLRVTVPRHQDGTFTSAHICVAHSEGSTTFAFRNATPLVQFSISDPTLAASSVTAVLSAAAGEAIAGTILADNGPGSRWPSATSQEITIPLAGIRSGTDIWAAVLPGKYSKGFRLLLKDQGGTVTKSFDCGIGMTLEAGTAVRMGDAGHITGSRTSFTERFGGCRNAKGMAIDRTNADGCCDNPGWDFGMCTAYNGYVQFTSPQGKRSWAMTPPLGIEGCALIAVTADRNRDSQSGMKVEICGPGHVKGRFPMGGPEYGTVCDTLELCGLSRDTRLKLTPTSTTGNHTRIYEVTVIPGGDGFPYMELPVDEVVLPPEAGKYVYPVEYNDLQGSMCCYMGQFRDVRTNEYLVDRNGKAIYPSASFRREGSATGSLTVTVPENLSGGRRKTSVDIYCSNALESLSIIQEPYEN